MKQLDLKNEEMSFEGRIDSLNYLGRKKDRKEEPFLKRLLR